MSSLSEPRKGPLLKLGADAARLYPSLQVESQTKTRPASLPSPGTLYRAPPFHNSKSGLRRAVLGSLFQKAESCHATTAIDRICMRALLCLLLAATGTVMSCKIREQPAIDDELRRLAGGRRRLAYTTRCLATLPPPWRRGCHFTPCMFPPFLVRVLENVREAIKIKAILICLSSCISCRRASALNPHQANPPEPSPKPSPFETSGPGIMDLSRAGGLPLR